VESFVEAKERVGWRHVDHPGSESEAFGGCDMADGGRDSVLRHGAKGVRIVFDLNDGHFELLLYCLQ